MRIAAENQGEERVNLGNFYLGGLGFELESQLEYLVHSIEFSYVTQHHGLLGFTVGDSPSTFFTKYNPNDFPANRSVEHVGLVKLKELLPQLGPFTYDELVLDWRGFKVPFYVRVTVDIDRCLTTPARWEKIREDGVRRSTDSDVLSFVRSMDDSRDGDDCTLYSGYARVPSKVDYPKAWGNLDFDGLVELVVALGESGEWAPVGLPKSVGPLSKWCPNGVVLKAIDTSRQAADATVWNGSDKNGVDSSEKSRIANLERRSDYRNAELLELIRSGPAETSPAAFISWFDHRVEDKIARTRTEFTSTWHSEFPMSDDLREAYESAKSRRYDLVSKGKSHATARLEDYLDELRMAGYTRVALDIDDALERVEISAEDPAGRDIRVKGVPAADQNQKSGAINVADDAFLNVLAATLRAVPKMDWLDPAASVERALPAGDIFDADPAGGPSPSFRIACRLERSGWRPRSEGGGVQKALLEFNLDRAAYDRAQADMFEPCLGILRAAGFEARETHRDSGCRKIAFDALTPTGLPAAIACECAGGPGFRDKRRRDALVLAFQSLAETDWDDAGRSLGERLGAGRGVEWDVDQIGICTYEMSSRDVKITVRIEKSAYLRRAELAERQAARKHTEESAPQEGGEGAGARRSGEIPDFDSMEGREFEGFCAGLLRENGYSDVEVTRGSGDQGIDIVAWRDGVKYGVQCKCYSQDVGNAAVREAFAGKTFYGCHVAVVLTNRGFTPAAIEAAKGMGVVLWDRQGLLRLIEGASDR